MAKPRQRCCQQTPDGKLSSTCSTRLLAGKRRYSATSRRSMSSAIASFMALSSGSLGAIVWRQGDIAQTYSLLEQCRARDKELITPSNVAIYMLGLAAAVAAQGEPGRAAHLVGVLEAVCEVTQALVPLPCHPTRIITQAALRTRLGEEAYAVACAEGRLMTLEQALEMSGGA